MFTIKMLEKILLPENIAIIDKDKIKKIKDLGIQNNYQIICHRMHPYYRNQKTEYEITKVLELTQQTNITKDFNDNEKTLYASEIRFPNDDEIIELLNRKNINKEAISKMNQLIERCLKNHLDCILAIIRYEKKIGLSLEQAIQIIKLKASLTNEKYQLNEEDQQTYDAAVKIFSRSQLYSTIENKTLDNLNDNETLQQLIVIGANYYGFTPKDLFLLINKINELMITCPDKIPSIINNKQKSI